MAVTNQMVAPRYAKALLTAATHQNQVETVTTQLQALASVFKTNPTIHTILHNAHFSAADKANLYTTYTKDASPLVANLLKYTQQYGRFGHLPAIITTFNRA